MTGPISAVWEPATNKAVKLSPPPPPIASSSGATVGAAFATKHLWATRSDPAERCPAGDFVSRHPGDAGLPACTAADRDIDGRPLTVWHTFGLTHAPHPEDWPIMPVGGTGFTLKPFGFFDRNLTLDVPPSTGGYGSCEAGGTGNFAG
ncbi:copper amine oxidase [Streptomyces sp. NBC_01361]|uniref:copper amine oxidase n=1 Tax=Streptomyces sp. NBC_01361 TaxID=2903838 RepID=UPI002E333F42|nr:hypothetical protein [Streptomyces sp. NBC_01361]